MSSYLELEFSECLGALGVVGNPSDAVKQDLVLLVQSSTENLKRIVPHIWFWHMVRHDVNVLDVSVLDELHQPVLGPG